MAKKSLVEILSKDGLSFAGEFVQWERSPTNPSQVRLELHVSGETYISDAETFFDALIEIRIKLESDGLLPRCYGASGDVYPSPMMLDMGDGDQGYRLKLGYPARIKDIVSIFDSTPELVPVSVEEQLQNYRQWLNSLDRKKL